MAYELINTYRVYEYEQEEIVESNLVANPDTGIVEQVTELKQPYVHIWAEFEVYQETIDSENRSNISASLKLYGAAGEKGNGFTLETFRSITSGYGCAINFGDCCQAVYYTDTKNKTLTVAPGETKSLTAISFDSTSTFVNGNSSTSNINLYHNFDGSLTRFQVYKSNPGGYYKHYPRFYKINTKFSFTGNYQGTEVTNKSFSSYVENITPDYLLTNRGLIPTTANNVTDEENPSFTYSSTGQKFFDTTKVSYDSSELRTDSITSLQVGLSLDGETIDIDYREIPVDGTSYTFNLTEEERELLRQKAQGSDTVPLYYMTKTERKFYQEYSKYTSDYLQEFTNKLERNLTIVGCNPTLNPTVKDIKEETIALTGDENTFIRYESMAEFAINATASKHATIVSQSVTCGSKTVEGLPYGVIDDVESGTFNFYVTDSRNMGAASAVFKNLVEYIKPTCKQELSIDIVGETGAAIVLKVSGNYFNGSFGAVDNTLQLQTRYQVGGGDWGEWTDLEGSPTFNGNTYELTANFTDFIYSEAYTFQCRAIDKLNIVQSSQYTIRYMPLFDWSEKDFNFNVPIQMNGETVLRHNEEANNTVLSASGGHIYLRPEGTNSTSGETIIYPDGSVKFGGEVMLANGAVVGDPTEAFADYVIESGETSMGTNGTWYWHKWASGKAECWGCRNFGNMAVTTTWGNLYRSAFLTQDLPEDLFVTTPDVININIVNATFGGWICKHENAAPSAVTTGSFIFVRPASATVTAPTYIGFHVIGVWKQ